MRRKLWVIVGSLFVAMILTGIIVMTANYKYVEAKKTTKVWSAAAFIPPGKTIVAKDLKLIEVPESFASGLLKEGEALEGKTLNTGVMFGNVIYQNQVSTREAVDKEYQKVVINTTNSSSALAVAGDIVDLYILDSPQQGNVLPGKLAVNNIKVLASYDQAGNVIAPPHTGDSESIGNNIGVKSKVPALVEVAIPPDKQGVIPLIVAYDKANRVALVKRQVD